MNYSILTSSNNINFFFLKRYVKSINSQILLAKELIFVCDNSKDFYLVEQYLRKNLNSLIRIIFIKNYVNLGLQKSYNKGIKKISYEIIFRHDIDDSWHKNHVNYNLNVYKKEKNFLIYSNSSKYFNKGLADLHLLIDNPTVHSSWLINKKLCRNFRYHDNYPEDFSTLSYYYRKNLSYKVIDKKTINYYVSKNSLSKKKNANKNIELIFKKNLAFYLKRFSYLTLIRDLGFFGILKLIKK